MPFGDNQLPFIEDRIRKATEAARTADNIANTCIKVSLRHHIAAGEALAAARELVLPVAWPEWLARLGITPREAKGYGIFPAEYRSAHRPENRKRRRAPVDSGPSGLMSQRRG